MLDFVSLLGVSLLSAVVLFLITKIIGRKQMSQLDFFDYINGITIGSIAAELATELDAPWKPLTAMVVYGVVAFSLSWMSSKFQRTRKYINGTPTILYCKGKLYRENMKQSKLDLSEFLVMCRQQGYFDLSAIDTAVFEYNGKLTILPLSQQRPIVPADLNLSPPPVGIFTELIMDGRLLEQNLKRSGLNRQWLEKQLHAQGYHCVEEIFLGVCDQNKALFLYPIHLS